MKVTKEQIKEGFIQWAKNIEEHPNAHKDYDHFKDGEEWAEASTEYLMELMKK